METLTQESIRLLEYLVPGFISAWIFYSLTSYGKPSQFERIVQALIFTIFIQIFVIFEKCLLFKIGSFWTVGVWNNQSALIMATIDAIFLGLAMTYLTNNDKLHYLFRRLGVTQARSYPTVWYGAFSEKVTFIVLHFKDERRLYGYPAQWPSNPAKGHFVLERPSWLTEDRVIPVTGAGSLLVNVKDIKWVEFMETSGE